MTPKNVARRIVLRHLAAGAPLPPTVLATRGVSVTTDDIEHALAERGLVVENVILFRVPDLDGPGVARWTGANEDGHLVRGTVVLQVRCNHHAMGATLVTEVREHRALHQSLRVAEDALTANERIARINVLARRVLELVRKGDTKEAVRRLEGIIELAWPVSDERRESAIFSEHPRD